MTKHDLETSTSIEELVALHDYLDALEEADALARDNVSKG